MSDRPSKRYYEEVNIMRGILALLVVLGHVTTQIKMNESFSAVAVYSLGEVIYSFHMALFFAISGFVSEKAISLGSVQEKIAYTKTRFKRLMIPYFAMGIVYCPFRIILKSISRNDYNLADFWKILIGQNPDGALWFLYVLFFFSIAACWLVTRKTLCFAMVATGIVGIATLFVDLPAPLDRLYFAPFFFAGVYIKMHYETLKAGLDRTWIKVLALLIFTSSNGVLLVSKNDAFMAGAEIAAACSGCFLIWWAALMIVQNEQHAACKQWLKDKLNIFGDYSMDIYMFAEPIKVVMRTVFGKCQVVVMVTMTFIISTALSMIVSKYIVRRVKLFKKLFLGS